MVDFGVICPKMSDEKAMEHWALVHSVLKNSPTIKTKALEEALRENISRSYLFDLLRVYENKGLIIRPSRGLVVLVKAPTEAKPSKMGFFGYLRWRREYDDAKKQRRKKELRAEIEARKQIITKLDEDDPNYLKKSEDIMLAYRKKYGVQE